MRWITGGFSAWNVNLSLLVWISFVPLNILRTGTTCITVSLGVFSAIPNERAGACNWDDTPSTWVWVNNKSQQAFPKNTSPQYLLTFQSLGCALLVCWGHLSFFCLQQVIKEIPRIGQYWKRCLYIAGEENCLPTSYITVSTQKVVVPSQ